MRGPMEPLDMSLNKYSLEFQYAELAEATRNFDPNERLGKGAFGAVYRGERRDGTEIAVKVFEAPSVGGFEDEVRVLSKFRHPNLVCLMGFARHGSQRFLIYELLEGGDVFKRIQKSSQGVPFRWRDRVSAAYDAACGLSHLHNSKPKAFHRDIKSPNILLDRYGCAKMADFGLACLSHSNSRHVALAGGTPGYACPWYIQRNIVTEGSEAYSFGVVLLELLTSSPPAWQAAAGAQGGAAQRVFLVEALRGDVTNVVIHADRTSGYPSAVVKSLADLAVRCTQAAEERRPPFAEIVSQLRALLRDNREGLAYAEAMSGQRSRFSPAEREPAGRAAAAQAPLPNPPPPAPAQHWAQAPAAPKVDCAMWSLVCIYVDGVPVGDDVPYHVRTVVHWSSFDSANSNVLKVGRLHQEQFFATALPGEATRHLVSREHFRVWASAAAGADEEGGARRQRLCGGGEGGPWLCNFLLENVSANGTTINGRLLERNGEVTPLSEGDIVGIGRLILPEGNDTAAARYTPFIEFRFSLEGSPLRDASADRQGAPVAAEPAAGADDEALSLSIEWPEPPPFVANALAKERGGGGARGRAEEAYGDEVKIWTPKAAPPERADLAPTPSPRGFASADLAAGAAAEAEDEAAGRIPPFPSVRARPGEPVAVAPEVLWRCTSLGGRVQPRYLLLLGGKGLRLGAAEESRRIIHGPPLDGSLGEACEPLTIGRGFATRYWQRMLRDEVFQALSREHALFTEAPSSSSGQLALSIQNLSKRRPARVVQGLGAELFAGGCFGALSNLDDENPFDTESPAPLKAGETRELRHGDIVVLIPNDLGSLWVALMDMQALQCPGNGAGRLHADKSSAHNPSGPLPPTIPPSRTPPAGGC